MTKIRILPSKMFCILGSLAAAWFIFAPVFGDVLITIGWIHIVILGVIFILDIFPVIGFRKIEISRSVEDVLSVGVDNNVKITVKNPTDTDAVISIRDDYPDRFAVTEADVTRIFPANTTSVYTYKACPPKRGDYQFGALSVRIQTILRFAVIQGVYNIAYNVKVYPDISQTRKHALLARLHRTREMGIRSSKYLGKGREFDRLRDYLPDDELRNIDWIATARRGKMTTREYDVERSQEIILMLDLGRTMASRIIDQNGIEGPSKADLAINASVLLSYVASQWDDRVGLCCFAGNVISYLPPGKGKTQSARVLDDLYIHQARLEESSYYDAFNYLSRKQRKRCTVFLFTDLIDEQASSRLISAVDLITSQHTLVCVALSDYELKQVIDEEPVKSEQIYNQAVALSILKDRRRAFTKLMTKKVMTVDAAPGDLNVATVNKYLQIKTGGMYK